MDVYFIVTILLVVFVFLLIRGELTHRLKQKYIFKPISTSLLVAIVIISLLFSPEFQCYKLLILLGLLFCFGGDIALMFESKKAFTAGLVLFLVGHIVYSVTLINYNGFISSGFIVPVVITVLGILMYVYLFPGLGNMKIQVLFYVFVISFMVLCAFSSFDSQFFSHQQAVLLSTGATLFYISDIILAINRFKIPFKYNRLSLAFYYSGQLLIALSTRFFIT